MRFIRILRKKYLLGSLLTAFVLFNYTSTATATSLDVTTLQRTSRDGGVWTLWGDDTAVEPLGTFKLEGNIKESQFLEKNNMWAVALNSGNLIIRFTPKYRYSDIMRDGWHLGEKMFFVVHTYNGNEWIQTYRKEISNVTTENREDIIYELNDIQLDNNSNYSISITYQGYKKVGTKLLFFDDNEGLLFQQQLRLYAVYDKANKSNLNSLSTPRKELGKKSRTNASFASNETLREKDPHFGWDMGTFVINNYTSETVDNDGKPVFLKNVGDNICLWYTLQQDINSLNGNNKITVTNAESADQEMEVERTDMGKGALFISHTDSEGHRNIDPVKYFDFLSANVIKGANTKVQLFEEGDYKVKLDYAIKDDSWFFDTSYYKVDFEFKVRNGNCMIYPFDLTNESELSNYDIAQNGFKLDMTKSKYLNINVIRQSFRVGETGLIVPDVRFNGPVKDLKEFTDEGMYIFTVKNKYTGAETTKTLFVGDNKYYKALSKTKMSIEELNVQIANGKIIEDDGSLKLVEN